MQNLNKNVNNITEGATTSNNNTSLEVPYAFGKLNVYEMLDPKTNKPSGVFNITDHERGFSFGVLKLADDQALKDGLTNLQSIVGPEQQISFANENFMNLNLNAEKKSHFKASDDLTFSNDHDIATTSKAEKSEEKAPTNSKISTEKYNMMKQKQENAYRVEKSKLSPADSSNESSGQSAAKKQKTSLHMFKERISNLSLPYSQMQWGSLLFYSGKDLVHTHYLWGEEAVVVSQKTLVDVKVPAKFAGGKVGCESLVDDFRYVLGEGFKLTRSKDKVEFERVESKISEANSKRIKPNNYKLLWGADQSLVVTSNEAHSIYQDKTIQSKITSEVVSFDTAYKVTESLGVAIVCCNMFMGMHGVRPENISHGNVTEMPYYMVLKVHAGYESLNNHVIKLMNKYLKKKNNFFGQVYNIAPDVNLKCC